jgi:hypothetical protein
MPVSVAEDSTAKQIHAPRRADDCPGAAAVAAAARPRETEYMATYDQAIEVKRRHEGRILGLPGITGVGVKLRDGAPVLEITVDPERPVPAELQVTELDGVQLVVERRRYEPQ